MARFNILTGLCYEVGGKPYELQFDRYGIRRKINACTGITQMEPKPLAVVKYKSRGAECWTHCFTTDELAAAQRQAMECALLDLRELKDSGPLLEQLERENPYFMAYPEARQACRLALQEKGFKGRARPRTVDTIKRDKKICLAVAWLNQAGLVIRDTKKPVETACAVVAKHVHLSESQVLAIWNDREGAEDDYLAPWKWLEVRQLSHEEILDHCLNGGANEVLKTRRWAGEVLRATLRSMIAQQKKRHLKIIRPKEK